MTRTYRNRKAAGLCPRCAAPAAPGRVHCAACIAYETVRTPKGRAHPFTQDRHASWSYPPTKMAPTGGDTPADAGHPTARGGAA